MKKLFFILIVLFSSTIIINAQTTYPTGDPTLPFGQLGISGQQTTRSGDFYIFGWSGDNATWIVLNGVEVPSLKQGWYLDNGQHTVTNANYICGFVTNEYYRDFITADLSNSNLSGYGITAPITSAVLRTTKFTSIPDTGYAVWDLHSVSTRWDTINTSYSAGSTTGQAVFNDLGTGSYYGNGVIDGSLPTTAIIETPLNAVAIADINAALGGIFVIGGRSDDFLPNPPPTAVTLAATNVAGTTATLNGTVNANGSSTDVTFIYGTTSGSLNQTINAVPYTVTGSTTTAVMADVTGLTSGETYYFQVRAENIYGAVVYGLEMEFTTEVAPTPSVPLSDWAIYIAIMLIGIAIFYRFKTRIA